MLGWIIGAGILAAIVLYTFAGLYELVTAGIPAAYRAFRYERHGVCGKCKQRYVRHVERPADQMYGPDEIAQWICPNGHVSQAQGQRRFAEW